ncbi:MAG TPA: non-reducing end alpha-L-arabinofuranosidase family hydrolase [Gemmataceae bacterium]|nr:non-reducing end alpha-L-arabinofuranosidase family hydrolase [Gemmataceae bacterium]
MRATIALLLCWSTGPVFAADPTGILSDRPAWMASGPLLAPSGDWHAVKDPSVVRFGDRWHVFVTLRGTKRSHATGYFQFRDWAAAPKSELTVLPNHTGFCCAPQVFYFSPHKTWYLICQASSDDWDPKYQPAFATSKEIADPKGWSTLKPLWDARPPKVKAWLDFWLICDESKAHLFYTSLNGEMGRCETALAKFPHGWSEPVPALKGDVFEASHTYRVKGSDRFLTVIEAQNGHGWRYFKSYVADRLDGPWTPLAAEKDKAFASMKNVTQPHRRWTDAVSHGELIRAGYDERLEVDPAATGLLIQGVLDKDRAGKNYGDIPWRIGLLDLAR